MGIKSMLGDLGVTGKRLRVKTDASVAKCLASRRGLGGTRHIEGNQLWLQEKINNGTMEIERVKGEINRADVLTKFKDGESLKIQPTWTIQLPAIGRHDLAPKLSVADPLDDLLNHEDDNEEQLGA